VRIVDLKFLAISFTLSSLGAWCLARSAQPPVAQVMASVDGAPPAVVAKPVEAGPPPAPADGDLLWARAKDGEVEDLARLAQREGSVGLAEASSQAERRLTAIRAMAYVEGAEALPWLANVATSGNEEEAGAALESVLTIASRPRAAVDPEDAVELREGCDKLLALAKDAKATRARRVASVSALRMLAERGCVDKKEIPADLDAR
jgi:hypothetical protein